MNLEDDESIGQQSKKTTTIFTPKSTGNNINSEYLYVFFCNFDFQIGHSSYVTSIFKLSFFVGPDADVDQIIDHYSPQRSVKTYSKLSPEKQDCETTNKSNGLETTLKQEKVYKEDFLQELLDKYVSRTTVLNRSIREEAIKVDHFKERRLEAEKSIEARLRHHLQITDVAISEVEEESEEDEEDISLPEMTADMESVVESALQSGGTTLIDAHQIPITGKDVNTLRGLNWLNDEIINFYLQMIVVRSTNNVSGWPKVYAFNTFFYPKVMDKG